MNTELCFGQRYDPELDILEPWYTNPAMDRIKQMDLSGKIVFEWGGGASTIWWRKKAKEVYTADHDAMWFDRIASELDFRDLYNGTIRFVPTHEGDQSEKRDEYVKMFEGISPDICVVDGIHRYECAEYAVKVLKPKILIIDNHNQDYVFICPALDELLKGVKMERFIQPDHTNHEGRPWATAIFYL